MADESLVYTASEAMKALGLSKDKFWELVHAGKIPALKISERKYLFSRVRLAEWVEQRTKAGAC